MRRILLVVVASFLLATCGGDGGTAGTGGTTGAGDVAGLCLSGRSTLRVSADRIGDGRRFGHVIDIAAGGTVLEQHIAEMDFVQQVILLVGNLDDPPIDIAAMQHAFADHFPRDVDGFTLGGLEVRKILALRIAAGLRLFTNMEKIAWHFKAVWR